MNALNRMLTFLGGTSNLARQTWRETFSRPFYTELVIEQIYQIGVRSFPLVMIVALSVGMVMALQFGVGLAKFGGKFYVPKIVSMSIVRELGPAFASLMMAARVGAGITSEVGSMKVTEQIDAIRALGTSPIKKIVVPRVIACLITVPILAVMANTIGVLGGLSVGVLELQLDASFYINKVLTTIKIADYLSGFVKTFFFAIFIAIPACYYGMNVKGGTQGVGTATTKSVVVSCILIVIGDYFLTKLLIVVESWL